MNSSCTTIMSTVETLCCNGNQRLMQGSVVCCNGNHGVTPGCMVAQDNTTILNTSTVSIRPCTINPNP